MAFRVVYIENEASMHVKLGNLVVNKGEGDIWLPISDISMIILDNLKISVTTRMMNAFAENNVSVVICNNEHLPIGFYSSYDNHSRVSKYIGFQIDKSKAYYDELWAKIVKAKISNQIEVLRSLDFEEEKIEIIGQMCENIEPGDPTNREAHAAKVYFNTLMGTSFSRGNEDILLNSGLDYGYAVLRAFIARVCVGYGLNTQLGIHHRNEYNRFNLVDDLIEPFRPYVDYMAYELLKDEKYFKREHRVQLIGLLSKYVLYKNKRMLLSNVIEDYVQQYARHLMSDNSTEICFPVFEGVGVSEDEI